MSALLPTAVLGLRRSPNSSLATCADLFSRSNLRQGSQPKYCYQVESRAACESSYISIPDDGTFKPCLWDQDQCKGSEESLRCIPKRGHALTGSEIEPCKDLQVLSPNPWFYSWGKMPPGSGYEACAGNHDSGFIPQWWGRWGILTKPAWGNAAAGLGFNEPDGHDQANMTAQEAASLWPDLEQRAAELGIKRLGSPATTTASFTNESRAFKWYVDFFDACETLHGGCKVDFLVVHMYKLSVSATMETLKKLHDHFGLPIWLKEFNKGGRWTGLPAQEHLAYMKEIVPLLEEAPYIERYAWMSARNDLWPVTTLIDADTGALTELGRTYRDLPFNVGK